MKRTRLLLAAAIVGAALIYLIIGGLRGSIVYYVTPSELQAQG
ncbi:MAG: cytochrome c maturation protein CcmE, partial [Armatimonadetes bacterium]|nr:cytochrome c maturation protein CcmE [Armatimonadota bacterium]